MFLKALDTIRVSSAKPGKLVADEEFEVSDHEGEQLVKRGLAVEIKGKPKTEAKEAAAPENKGAPKPENKAKK